MKKLVIDRKRWNRGRGGSSLLNNQGKMCCLGFLAKSFGHSEEDILNVTIPSGIENANLNKWHGLLQKSSVESQNCVTNTCNHLMEINDNFRMTSSYRENRLKELFKKCNIDVEFIC